MKQLGNSKTMNKNCQYISKTVRRVRASNFQYNSANLAGKIKIITTRQCDSTMKTCRQKYELPRWLSDKGFTPQCRRRGFIPRVKKIPWRRKWQPRLYSCLENPMDRGNWQTTVHGVAKESDTTYQLNNNINRESTLKLYTHQRTVNFAMMEKKQFENKEQSDLVSQYDVYGA